MVSSVCLCVGESECRTEGRREAPTAASGSLWVSVLSSARFPSDDSEHQNRYPLSAPRPLFRTVRGRRSCFAMVSALPVDHSARVLADRMKLGAGEARWSCPDHGRHAPAYLRSNMRRGWPTNPLRAGSRRTGGTASSSGQRLRRSPPPFRRGPSAPSRQGDPSQCACSTVAPANRERGRPSDAQTHPPGGVPVRTERPGLPRICLLCLRVGDADSGHEGGWRYGRRGVMQRVGEPWTPIAPSPVPILSAATGGVAEDSPVAPVRSSGGDQPVCVLPDREAAPISSKAPVVMQLPSTLAQHCYTIGVRRKYCKLSNS